MSIDLQSGFHPLEQFDVRAMAQFMRNPEQYNVVGDALNPDADAINFEEFLLQPDIFTVAACFNMVIVGYVYVLRRTSIGGEIHCGFHAATRGKIAKTFIEYTIAKAWDKGFLKLWTYIPADNRPAIAMAKACDFTAEGRLRNAIMRLPVVTGRRFPDKFKFAPGPRDLLLFSLERPWRAN